MFLCLCEPQFSDLSVGIRAVSPPGIGVLVSTACPAPQTACPLLCRPGSASHVQRTEGVRLGLILALGLLLSLGFVVPRAGSWGPPDRRQLTPLLPAPSHLLGCVLFRTSSCFPVSLVCLLPVCVPVLVRNSVCLWHPQPLPSL